MINRSNIPATMKHSRDSSCCGAVLLLPPENLKEINKRKT